MRNVLILFMVLGSLSASAATIKFKSSVNDFLKGQFQKTLDLLPANYLNSAKGEITIEMKDIADSMISDNLCQMDEGEIFATTKKSGKKHHLRISPRLVELAQNNIQKFDCSHGTFERFLTAVIAHELTHVKDNFEHISTDDDFERIVGVKHLTRRSKKALLNQNVSNSPDAYEFKNLEESLAVNTEYLLLDPEFECRKPATAKLLSKKLGIPLKGLCQRNEKVLIQSSYIEDNYQQAVSINPERIYQVHYLFAGKGKALMSRWGHAMFRLVVCAPHRKKVGPECLEDVSHHLALSYRAFINDLTMDYSKGMFGGYPSQLFVFRFHEVQQEYTKFELRDLFSIPLKLTSDQKKEFIDVTLERFWNYQGKYYFIDNNCATEAKKHLAIALDDKQSKYIHSVTPLKIYKDIINGKHDLTVENIDGLGRDQLIENSLLIPSISQDLEKRFRELKTLGLYPYKTLKDFLVNSRGEARLESYKRYFSEEMKNSDRKDVVLKIIYIERYITTKFMLELPKKAFAMIRKNEAVKNEVMKMGGGILSLFIQPWLVVKGAYGVPTQTEMETLYPKFLEDRKLRLKDSIEQQMKNLERILKDEEFTKDYNEFEGIKKIKAFTNYLFTEVNKVN